MTNLHISKEEWQLFFLNKNQNANVKLNCRVLAHVAGCPECRELYDKATALSRTARAYNDALCTQHEESGYAAVASFSGKAPQAAGINTFTVDIDAEDGKAVFLADTVEATGSARRYAVNPEQEDTCLREDGGAFILALTGTTLTIRVESALADKVTASLRSFTKEQSLVFTGCEATAELPGNDMSCLELSFA